MNGMPKETLEEFSDEMQENILEKALTSMSASLSVMEGHQGKIGWGNVGAVFLAGIKCTRLGKSRTRTYPVSVDGRSESIAQTSAEIRSDAESRGAIVTDFGGGVLSIQHQAVDANGDPTGEYVTEQFRPLTKKEMKKLDRQAQEHEMSQDVEEKMQRERDATLEMAQEVEGLQDLDPESKLADAIFEAHSVEPTGVREDGSKYYTAQDIAEKARIVQEAMQPDDGSKLTPEQRAKNKKIREDLIRGRILGNPEFMVDSEEVLTGSEGLRALLKEYGIYQGFTADEALHELIIKRANSTEPLSVDHKRQAEEVYRWTLTLAYPETVRKFQEVFDISNERAHEIAVEYANNAYQEETRLFQEGGEYKHLHTSMLDNKLHKLIEDHGVSIDEIDGVREDATSLCDGIGNAVGMDTINSRMGEWRRKQGDAGKDKIVDYQLRAAVAEAVRRGDSKLLLNLESAIETQQKSSIYLNQLAIEINLHSEEEGSVLDLSLDTNNKMLWRKLYRRGGKEKAAAMSELKKCLNSFGLNPDRVTRAIENASTTEAEIRQAPDEYNEDYVYEGVAMRIVDNITTLESEVKGAVKHFHEKRGINLFNRYPTEILTEIYEQETGKAAPGMKIKGHMLILDPESDYNGAFETPDQIRKIAKEAKDKGFALHIAESGTRYSRYRQLVRCRREFGPLHHAVIGGHTSESQIMQLGPNPEDVITGKELQNLIKKKKKNKLSEKEQKLLNKIKEFFDPDAVIYFKACSSGLAGGIADRSSDLINVRTVGPESPTNIKTIRLDLGEVEFHKGIAAKMYFPSAEKQAEYEAAVESTAQRAELMELAQAARYGKPEQLRARLEAGPEIDPQMHSDLIREVAFDEYTVFSEEEKQMLDNGNIYDVIISQRLKGARKDTADDADHSYARYRMRDLADSGLITAEDAEHDLNLTSESETSESTVEDAETDSETVVDADLETQCTRCRERLSKTDAELRERFMQEKAVIELEGDPAAQKKMIESRIKAYRDSVDMISSPEIQRRTRKVFETKFGKVEMSPEAEQRLMDHINELALEQQLDNPEQYVSHGFDHSLNVMDQIERTVEMNPKIAEYMQNMYGLSAAESAFMLKMVGVFHDFGYPELGKRGDGGLGKALHAATGAEIAANPELRAMMREALKVGEADGISEAQFEKLMHDFRDSILYHSADKVEVFRDTKIKLGHGEFIVDSENIVDIFTEYYAENQQTEAITIQCSEEVEAKIRERLGPEGVGDIKFERPNERDLTMHEGQQRFRGRSVDLSTGKDEMLGIQYKEVGVDEDPMNFIIRLTDNCDMTPERFSALQRTEAFSSLYRKLFPFEGQIPPTGQVMEVLEQKTADTRAILDEFAECQRSLNSPELDAIVKRVQNGESVSAKELRNAFKSAVIDKVMIENHDELVTTAQRLGIDPEIFATKFRKIGMSQNTQTMRHFGGCEPVQSVDLQERTGYPGEMELSVTVDRETYERLNRETVQEKSSDTDGSSVVVNVSLGDYQIWRAYEAFRSLRQPGGKPIRIVVRDQNGQPMHGEGTDFESHFQAQNELPPS